MLDGYEFDIDFHARAETKIPAPKIEQTIGAEQPPKASKSLRDFLSNPKVTAILHAHDKSVDYPELEKFLSELDYIEELCSFNKASAIQVLQKLRTTLSDKRTRPGRAEWVSMSGVECDQFVKDLRKCIAVLGA